MPSNPLARRLAAAVLLALAASASADAQALFVNACIASAPSDVPFDADRVCGCAASTAMSAGVEPRALDQLIDYASEDGTLDAATMPEALRAAAAATTDAIFACAVADGAADPAGAVPLAGGVARAEPAPPVSGVIPRAAGATIPSAAAPPGATSASPPSASAPLARDPSLPEGLRTGNGTGSFRTSSPSPGGAIRILG